ncbi:MAG: hypothetical protein LBD43_01795 [Holosporales bacterium]|jgi:transposase|nr:hypothetical protein [Holosporales bacterium]
MRADNYHRHDISDSMWELLEAHLTRSRGIHGNIAQDGRTFIGHRRFCRLRDRGIWKINSLIHLAVDTAS